MECLRLRVRKISIPTNATRSSSAMAKGTKTASRCSPMIKAALREHLARVKILHEKDLTDALGEVYLPDALERKYRSAAREWPWQWSFPAGRYPEMPRSGKKRRHHLDEQILQRAVRHAVNSPAYPNVQLPHLPSHLCHAPARSGLRHSHRPGTPRPPTSPPPRFTPTSSKARPWYPAVVDVSPGGARDGRRTGVWSRGGRSQYCIYGKLSSQQQEKGRGEFHAWFKPAENRSKIFLKKKRL